MNGLSNRYHTYRQKTWPSFGRGLSNLDHKLWDKQIEADARTGKLERLIDEACAEFTTGKAREL